MPARRPGRPAVLPRPPAPPAHDDRLDRLLGLVEDLTGRVASVQAENAVLRGEIATLQAGTPQYRPMETDDLHNLAPRMARHKETISGVFEGLNPGESDDGSLGQLPITAWAGNDKAGTSQLIDKNILRSMRPRFEQGQTVRVNPAARKEGAGGADWASILGKTSSDGVGEVKTLLHYAKNGQWKYKVRVPGLTTRSGDGFYEYELLPA